MSYDVPAVEFKRTTEGKPPQLFVSTVVAVNENGTVSLGEGTDPVTNVACSSSYLRRRAGDTVLVARVSRDWLVLGTTARGDGQDELETDLKVISDDVRRLDNVRPRISFGTGAIPTGFLSAAEVGFRDAGGGRVDLYFRSVTDPGTGSTTPEPGLAETVSIYPDAQGSWRTSGQQSDKVIQGDWTGRGDYLGGWFYGTQIPDTCSGRPVKAMRLMLTRRDDGHGWGSGVTAHLDLHTRQSKGKPSPYSGVGTLNTGLTPGEKYERALPDDHIAELVAGRALGFMLSGSGQRDYLITSNIAGRLDIDFA